LWNGTSGSVVDLHPNEFFESSALAASVKSQVGYGYASPTGTNTHALLWTGTAESVVDLNPVGFEYSVAEGISGNSQVGYGFGIATGGATHALLWYGAAESVVDLHPFLANLPMALTQSVAHGIDINGMIVGYATGGGNAYAVLWTPVPEPSTGAIHWCGVLAAALLARRQRAIQRSFGTSVHE
jgi:uncharacterized membrane protein